LDTYLAACKFFGNDRVFTDEADGICTKIQSQTKEAKIVAITEIYAQIDQKIVNPDKSVLRRLLAQELFGGKVTVIGFCGKMGAGKSTCANHLKNKYGFVKVSFASKLKDICQQLFGFSHY
jgi:dephospho-CoA kinase